MKFNNLMSVSALLVTNALAQFGIGTNNVINARNLYLFPKVGDLASQGKNGQGVSFLLNSVH
jgi:hypothetical protein